MHVLACAFFLLNMLLFTFRFHSRLFGLFYSQLVKPLFLLIPSFFGLFEFCLGFNLYVSSVLLL